MPGSMPWLKKAQRRRSTLPVRSPCPSRQPSIRSAPGQERPARRGGHARSPIVVRVDAEAPRTRGGSGFRLSSLNLVGKHVRGRALHRGGQIQDDLAALTRLHTSMTDSHLEGEVQLGLSTKISGEYSSRRSSRPQGASPPERSPRARPPGRARRLGLVRVEHHLSGTPEPSRCRGEPARGKPTALASSVRSKSSDARLGEETEIVSSSGTASSSMSERTEVMNPSVMPREADLDLLGPGPRAGRTCGACGPDPSAR